MLFLEAVSPEVSVYLTLDQQPSVIRTESTPRNSHFWTEIPNGEALTGSKHLFSLNSSLSYGIAIVCDEHINIDEVAVFGQRSTGNFINNMLL